MKTEQHSEVTDTSEGSREPTAVIGLACRLPAAPGPTGYWDLLRDGRSAITEMPGSRWEAISTDARSEIRRGGFLDGIADFDAGFFSINPGIRGFPRC